MSKVDDTAISQDDSGALHASTLVIMSNDVGKPVESLIFDEYNQWAADAEVGFATDVKSEFRMLQGDLVTGVYDVENVLELRREVEGVENFDEVKSIAQKTGNTYEFTDTKSTNTNERYGVSDFDFPVECRECGENQRMSGSFRCPECDPNIDPESDDYELVGKMMEIEDSFEISTITASGEELEVRVADTDDKRYQGLSGVSKDELSEDGMVFVYPTDGTHRLVWRDSKFPLDVVHIEYDGIVSKVGSLKEKGDGVKGEGVFALEVPLGVVDDLGISKGDRLDVSDVSISTADSPVGRFEKSLGGINYVNEKIRNRGGQLSLNAIDKIGEAYRQQVWPKELQKSPSWTGNDDVTQDTQEWVSSILELEDPMWDSYDNIPMAAGLTVKQELKESLTQHQGWSLDSIDTRLREEFPHMEPFERQRIARQEVAGVLNRSKIAALEARPGDSLVRWVGPDDDSTTDLCESLREKTKDGVPFSEFMDMLKTHADEYGGTPRRVDQGLPHFQCRYTVEVVEE